MADDYHPKLGWKRARKERALLVTMRSMNKHTFQIQTGTKPLVVEHNDLAIHADGSITMSMGDTTVMAVAVMGGVNTYPDGGLALRVDYEERYYARGEILGSRYNKREGRPTEEATLTARVIDRTIRPFFPDHFDHEVQVVVTVLSLGEYDPDVLAVNAACLALQTSTIPWDGPVACVRISQNKDVEPVVNPTYLERKHENNYFNAIMAGTADAISMIEVEGSEISNDDLRAVCATAGEEFKTITEGYREIASQIGKAKQEWDEHQWSDTLTTIYQEHLADTLESSVSQFLDGDTVDRWKREFKAHVREADSANKEKTDLFIESKIKHAARAAILSRAERMDGRAIDAVRDLYAQAGGVAPKQHGSGVFYRGDTHVLSVATLGSLEDDALLHDEMEIQDSQRWMLHYNFPSYSVGEVGRMRSPGRREIGHGKLAEKAISRVLPHEDDFPYAIRSVCEVFSSNGSTSMASVCAASLSLMDAGVPLEKHVAGIACGLVREDDNQVILTDILGKEDFYGDMDFKIAGTRDGITAIQLDCKIHGLDLDTIAETLERSTKARMKVLDAMEQALPAPRELTSAVERIETMDLPESKIGLVIGKGGVTIKGITKESGARIDIKDSGVAWIMGSEESITKAKEMIADVLEPREEELVRDNPKAG